MTTVNVIKKRFGRLVCLTNARTKQGRPAVRCKCDCGNTTTVEKSNLVGGHTRSCGCLRREITSKTKSTHRMSKTRPFRIWAAMLSRCGNPNLPYYPNYGGRGIRVCLRWKQFQKFWEDMRHGYSDKLSIDRTKNYLGYCKSNCRWATPKQQANNRRKRRK